MSEDRPVGPEDDSGRTRAKDKPLDLAGAGDPAELLGEAWPGAPDDLVTGTGKPKARPADVASNLRPAASALKPQPGAGTIKPRPGVSAPKPKPGEATSGPKPPHGTSKPPRSGGSGGGGRSKVPGA